VTVPIAAAAGLLIALDRHTAERHLDVDDRLQECEGECEIERFFRQRCRLDDAVLDVHPRQLIVQRDRRRDGRKSLQRPLDYEPHPDARQALAARAHKLGLGQRELGRILELVAVA